MRKNKKILLAILMAAAMLFNCTAAVFAGSEDDFVEYVTPYAFALSSALAGYTDYEKVDLGDTTFIWYAVTSYWQWMYENEGAEYLTKDQVSAAQEVFNPGSKFIAPTDDMIEYGEVVVEKKDGTETYSFPFRRSYIDEYNGSDEEDFEIDYSDDNEVEAHYYVLFNDEDESYYCYDFTFVFKENKRSTSRLSAAIRPKYILSDFELPSTEIEYDLDEITEANRLSVLLDKYDNIFYHLEYDDGTIRDTFYLDYNGELSYIAYSGTLEDDYYDSYSAHYKGFDFYEDEDGVIKVNSSLLEDDDDYDIFDYSLVEDRCADEVSYSGESADKYHFGSYYDYYEEGYGENNSDAYIIDRDTFEIIENSYYYSYYYTPAEDYEDDEGSSDYTSDYTSGTIYAYYDEMDNEDPLFDLFAEWGKKLRIVTVLIGEYNDDGKLEFSRHIVKVPKSWEYLPYEAVYGYYSVFMDKSGTKEYAYPGNNKNYTIYLLPAEEYGVG